MRLPESEIKKIAIFRVLQLGDMLCSIPAIRSLRAAYPHAHITLLGLPWASCLVDRFPNYFDSFKHFPGFPGLPGQKFNHELFLWFLSEIQHQCYDLVLQMQGNGSIVNPMVELFGAKYTAGFYLDDDYCPDRELFLLYPDGIHEIERHLKLMQHLQISSTGTDLEFPLTAEDLQEFQALNLPVTPGQYVCVHPGSRGAWRQWPPEYFASMADYCAERGFTPVITGANDEIEIVKMVASKMNNESFVAAGKTSLGTVGLLIKNAALLVSNCTGVSHMAAAFKTPSVVISMDGEPERWAPIDTERHRTIDWTKTPHYTTAFGQLETLLNNTVSKRQEFSAIS